ncbi:VCBS repeat-containing protein [Spirosoma sp. KCTC 42546]|uniref:FG-GAP repeat domain-containing protein n=1 Tax=Spirosoma sp. KCTC 42546 TaxID=2520506 RepID=UPI00115B1A22|nr:VCBS repeat-containing protein [Spirosoma sp. KCTC 42546]QDK79871.1 VCBS repeat-containing protein [Spirosoma sp. KCTC 42546]
MKRKSTVGYYLAIALRAFTLFSTFSLLTVGAANAQHPFYAFVYGDATPTYADATSSHVPQDPDLHALDATFVDVDKDGDLDVVIAVEMGANRLYLNDGKGKLTWKKEAFGTARHDSEHVLSADFNKDGYPDLVFVAEDDHAHQLFYGGPGGTFKEVTDRLPAKSEGNALAVADVNNDGLPDILIGNSGEERPGKTERASGQDFLWLNDAKRPGYFIDATITHMPKDNDDTQDIKLADLDGDGDLDMIVANETPPSRLLLNDGQGHFSDASDRLELLVPMETRMVQIVDVNSDKKPDLLFFNLTSNNHGWDKDPQVRLLLNDGNGRFTDQTKSHLPENRFSSWGGAIVDFNRDGRPDILVGAIQVPGFVPLQVRAWKNEGNGQFKDVTTEVVPSLTVGRHWGMALGDLNGDGIDDIFIGAWGTQARLLLSRSPVSSESTKSKGE